MDMPFISGRAALMDAATLIETYGDLPDCGLDEIECIGRVIWAGRKIA